MFDQINDIIPFVLIGFAAQLIDGALGMAYGVSSNTFLLSLGISPAIASASVHSAEMVTTAISGISHFKLGNVHIPLFKTLVLPGMLGAVLGAYILTQAPGDTLKPYINLYLLIIGLFIIRKSLRQFHENTQPPKHIAPLAVTGGFFDAIGGGGWGPIVTSTLVASGQNPRFAIGSVNSAEFFVTTVQVLTFIIFLGKVDATAVAGLIIGGVPAAPFAALLTKRVRPRHLMLLVGILIVATSLRTLLLAIL